MNTHTIEKTQMQTLESLAQANMKVSETKNSLAKLQEEETEYLVLREKKALDKIQKVVAESADILKKATENYKEVSTLVTVVNEVCGFVAEAEDKISKLFDSFDEKSAVWEQKCIEQAKETEKVKNQLKLDRTMIENDKKSIEKTKKSLMEQKLKLDDRRAMVERAIIRLKANRI